jgi:hypothetical protein
LADSPKRVRLNDLAMFGEFGFSVVVGTPVRGGLPGWDQVAKAAGRRQGGRNMKTTNDSIDRDDPVVQQFLRLVDQTRQVALETPGKQVITAIEDTLLDGGRTLLAALAQQAVAERVAVEEKKVAAAPRARRSVGTKARRRGNC